MSLEVAFDKSRASDRLNASFALYATALDNAHSSNSLPTSVYFDAPLMQANTAN
jgi:hypothetical protein